MITDSNKKLKINREVLKIVAMLSMLIDHIAAGLIPKTLMVYGVMRLIGRIAMPLYAFMIAEGLYYTRNKWKYTGRVALVGLIAVVPYNLYILGGLWKWRPNVLFTYALAMVAIIVADAVKNNYVKVLVVAAACVIAELLQFEYTWIPVVIISLIYYFRGYVPIVTYKDNNGFSIPSLFYYAFYPGHLAVLLLIKIIFC